MKKNIRISSFIFTLVAVAAASAGTGKYYGLWWDGSAEHFGSVDPYTGDKTSLSVIPGVQYIVADNSAFDTDCNRYVFIGNPGVGSVNNYFVIDAASGAVLSESPPSPIVNNLAYSPKDKTFYGLWWDGTAEHFGSVDPYTGERTSLSIIPGVTYISLGAAFDTDCNRYIFQGMMGSIFAIDAHTGAVVSQSSIGANVNNIAYSPKDKAVYGIWWDGSAEHFGSVDLSDGSRTSVSVIPGISYINMGTGVAFDTDCNRYAFGGVGALYVLDAGTGATLAGVPSDNIGNLEYGGSSSSGHESDPHESVVAASSESEPAVSGVKSFDVLKTSFSVQPNLSSKEITLVLKNGDGEGYSFVMHDMSGKSVVKMDGIRTGNVRIDGNGLTKGMYFYQLRSSRAVVGSGRLVME